MNKKILGIITVLLGVVVISLGITLQFSSKKKESKDKEKEPEVSQNIEIKNINKYGDKEVCSNSKQISSFLNTNNSYKISFTYTDCVHEYNLSYKYKQFWDDKISSNSEIYITIADEKNTIDKYMNSIKAEIISSKESSTDYLNFEYTDVQKFTNKNGLEVQLIQEISRISSIFPKGSFHDHEWWYIAVKLSDEEILKIEISINDGTMSKDAIKEFFDNVKVEKEQAVFSNIKKEGDYQIGSIRQNKNNEYEHGYIINFKIPNKYPEIISVFSDYNSVDFTFEELRHKIYFSLSLEKETFDSIDKRIESYHKYALERYTNNEHYRNIKDSKIQNKKIAGKDVSYFVISSDYYLDGQKTTTDYTGEIYYKIDDTMFYYINISNTNEPINEKFISELLDFTIEEY